MPSTTELTPLEYAIVRLFYEKYANIGFPSPDDIRVDTRENTGAGRYVNVSHPGTIHQADGPLWIEKYLLMSNLPHGGGFDCYIQGGKLLHIEMYLNGDYYWDGSEGDWEICDWKPVKQGRIDPAS